MEDCFWGVQQIWAKTENSPFALGKDRSATSAYTACEDDVGVTLLKVLNERESFDSYVLAQELGKDHQQIVGAIKSVQSQGEVSLHMVAF